jgi:hypothetical protein
MRAFDTQFKDLATRETLVIDSVGAAETFVFREFYCALPGCDCRRVVLIVMWVEERRNVATIHYAFDASRRNEPRITLEPGGPQSEHSPMLLAWFSETIANEPVHRKRLLRHYEMWRHFVDAGAPAKPKAKKAVVAGSRDLERVIAKTGAAGSKTQQRFRKLLEKVDRLRQRLGFWKQQRADIDREIALYRAVFFRHARLGRDLVVALDRAHGGSGLTKAERTKLTALIGDLAEMLIAQGGNDELKEIYNRHTRRDFDAEAAKAEAEDVEAMRTMIEDQLGIEVDDEHAGSVDELRAAVRAQMDALEQEEAARKARRRKTPKQAATEARRADEKKSADKAIQDVYRTLARALHPDHEQDAAEQARKTRLMSEVNVAYEAKDLLRLLALQLELERVDETRVETMAEERLKHFSRILDEQAVQIAAELAHMETPFRMELGLGPSAVVSPDRVIVRIRADAAGLELQIERSARDLATFSDVALLKTWLRAQPAPRR